MGILTSPEPIYFGLEGREPGGRSCMGFFLSLRNKRVGNKYHVPLMSFAHSATLRAQPSAERNELFLSLSRHLFLTAPRLGNRPWRDWRIQIDTASIP